MVPSEGVEGNPQENPTNISENKEIREPFEECDPSL